MEGLFQRELAALSGVQDLIGEGQPAAAGGKFYPLVRAVPLKRRIQFGRVMQGQHQLVIPAAPAAGDAQPVEQPRLAGPMRPYPRQKTARKILEWLADIPAARAVRRDIGEKTQD